MTNNYLCPHCKAYLRIWKNIIFTIRKCDDDKKGLILLDAELGNYSVISHPALHFIEGECVEFICPVCHKSLTASGINDHLASVIMVDENNEEYDVYFSKVAGEHSTFVIKKDDIIEKYGENSSAYMNYFMSKLKRQMNKKE